MSGYIMDSDYCTMVGVAVKDGAVYAMGNDWATSVPKLIRYSDKYLTDRTVVMSGVGVNVYAGATEMAYDATTDLFYITDASNNIYSMTDTGETHFVDILGSGTDINGLAINSTPSYSVRYTDGVDGEVIFADQQYFAQEGSHTPNFNGTPMRAGYSFAGWTPEVAEFVTENVVYTATWTINDYTITFDARGGEVSPAEITVTYGQPVGTLPVPTREGFDFVGWFDENGTRYTDETVYLVDGNITLNARWSMTAYTVTFVDSLNNNAVIGTLTVGRGDVIDSGEFPVAPEHQGYVFCGWNYDGEPVMNDMTVSTVYHLLGDVDMDGCINGIDALMALRKAMGIIELTENQCRLADVDFNGEVTVNDAVRILRHALDIELLG